MNQAQTDVLIIGAGPAGMTLATALNRHAIRFRIVDRDDGPTTDTRAPVLWQRTQEFLAAMGIRDQWLPESDEMREESLHLYGKAIDALSTSALNSPYTKALYNGQNITERLLDRHLSASGAPVEYGKEAIAFRDGGEHATVTLRGHAGEEQVQARWVVAAEGTKSVVRHAVGLDFEGEKYVGYRIHIANVCADWTLATPVGQTFFYVEKHGYMGGQRLPGEPNRMYFYILVPDERPDDDSNEVGIDEIQDMVRRFSGDEDATLSNPIWLTTARYRHGVADTYRKGHALLIGDTARVAPPLYGQGMNYAMHDAWNLAWKLAFVVKGLAPEALLDTFASERRKLGAELDARIDSTFRFITEPKPFQAPVVRTVASVLLSSNRIKHAFDSPFTEMELTYAGSGLNEAKSALGQIEAGVRAPALWVKRLPDCALANLLDLSDGIAWTLLVIAATEEDAHKVETLTGFARLMANRFPDTVQAVLLSSGPKRPQQLPFLTLVDAEARYIREHGLPPSGMLLIRPDGYVALTTRSDTAEIEAYLGHWLR